MPDDRVVRIYPVAYDNALRKLALENRETLIRAAVPDREAADQLVEINNAIERLRVNHGELVGAWGLGCGAGCKTQPGAMVSNPVERLR